MSTRRWVALVAAASAIVLGGQWAVRQANEPAARQLPPTAASLTVAPEDTGAHYDRDAWGEWQYFDGGCDRRELLLRERGQNVVTGKACRVLAGTWVSPYDGVTVTATSGEFTPSELDVDHVVPLAEAERSGARTWTAEQRESYANDPAVLAVVTAKSNRSKGDQDVAHWLPAQGRCEYVRQWVEIKTRYHLTADQAEVNAIAAVLDHC
ncbi:HNH endonuclease family protein [Amycolatopsis thermoflava]|uniref:HNH endonuclease family protein n=1 Tax=Amycolatopsis thermoflava TaxID=84480 RepID=UPI0003FFACFC|nr:HNH endonuclease family protein [Amycolatopsis thermoflava]